MAVYIESEEVSKLIEQYAKREGKNKTAALRDLLIRELKIERDKTPDELYEDAMDFVRKNAGGRKPITKADFDSLYEYLNLNVD